MDNTRRTQARRKKPPALVALPRTDHGMWHARDLEGMVHLSLSNLPLRESWIGTTLCRQTRPLYRLDEDAKYPLSKVCSTCAEENK